MINNAETYITKLKSMLENDHGRFANYQELPPEVIKKLGVDALDIYVKRDDGGNAEISLDEARYNWLINRIDPKDMFTVEIGSSLGYFVLRLATEFSSKIVAYEPVEEYAKISKLMAEICGVERYFQCFGKGVSILELSNLPESDLIINLNVLHHAGIEFDREVIDSCGSWELYARDYLELLSSKGKYLFFQTGNISSGPLLFSAADSISFVGKLLENSGWKVISVGVVDDFNEMNYKTFSKGNLADAPATSCRRNPLTNMVDYFRAGEICASLPTGLPARPLWFCQSVHGLDGE